jgi:predicted molibdopterin-dependent oxidoreductase YjgC
MTRKSEGLNRIVPECFVEINPRTRRAGNRCGSAGAGGFAARGDHGHGPRSRSGWPRGMVFIPFHFAEAAANALTNSACDPQARIPEFKVCAVRVVPCRGGG